MKRKLDKGTEARRAAKPDLQYQQKKKREK